MLAHNLRSHWMIGAKGARCASTPRGTEYRVATILNIFLAIQNESQQGA